jgi:hypothetical protein
MMSLARRFVERIAKIQQASNQVREGINNQSALLNEKLGELIEGAIADFAMRWEQTFGVSYGEIRHEIKSITLSSVAATRHCQLGGVANLENPANDDLFVFMDDDDWTAPHLFEVLRSAETPRDGCLWGSIFLGSFLVDVPGTEEVPGRLAGTPALQKRALHDFLYTNNYAVTGRAIKRLGASAVFEHSDGQRALRAGQFAPLKVRSYLSCANKHPWCTMAISYNSHAPGFLEGLYMTLLDYAQALECLELDADTRWIAPYLDRLKALVARLQEQGGAPR